MDSLEVPNDARSHIIQKMTKMYCLQPENSLIDRVKAIYENYKFQIAEEAQSKAAFMEKLADFKNQHQIIVAPDTDEYAFHVYNNGFDGDDIDNADGDDAMTRIDKAFDGFTNETILLKSILAHGEATIALRTF